LTTHSSELKWVTHILKTDLCSLTAALSYHVSFDYSVIRFTKNNHRRKNIFVAECILIKQLVVGILHN